jgi:hypothetical protein
MLIILIVPIGLVIHLHGPHDCRSGGEGIRHLSQNPNISLPISQDPSFDPNLEPEIRRIEFATSELGMYVDMPFL